MTRQSFAELDCSLALAAEHLADKWVMVILRNAFNGMKRFDDFYTHLGVSSKVLAARLKALTDAEILYRREVAGDKRAVEYKLTPKGLELFPLLVFMGQWADRWWPPKGGPRNTVCERANGLPVQDVVVLSASGTVVTAKDAMVRQRKVGSSKVLQTMRSILVQRSKKTG